MNTIPTPPDADPFEVAVKAFRAYIDTRIRDLRNEVKVWLQEDGVADAKRRNQTDNDVTAKFKSVVKRIEKLETQLDSAVKPITGNEVLDRVLTDSSVSQFSISMPEQHKHTMLAEGDRVVLPNGKTYRVSKMPNGKLDIAFTGKIEQEKAA